MASRRRKVKRSLQWRLGAPIEQTGGGPNGGGSRHSDISLFARLTSLKLIGSVANGFFGLALIVVVSRGLNASRAGAFFAGLALLLIMSNLAELGADSGFVRMIPRYRATRRTQDVRRMLWVGLIPVLVIGTLLGALVFVFAPSIVEIFFKGAKSKSVVPYLRVLAPFIPLSAASTALLAATRGFGTVTPSVVIDNIGKPAIRPILAAGAIILGLGATGLALAWALPIVPGLLIGAWWLWFMVHSAERRDEMEAGSPRAIGPIGGEFWRFSAPRGLGGFSSTVLGWLDTLLVSGLKGTAEAGVYTASIRLMALGGVLSQAVVVVISPLISGLFASKDHDRAEALYHTVTWWLMAATWPVFLALAAFAPFVLSMFGPEFTRGQSVLVILSLVNLLNSATGPVSAVLLMAGKSTWTLLNSVAATVLNIALNLLLIPRFGILGAGAALAASIAVLNLAALVETRVLLHVRWFGAGAPVVGGAAVLCYGGIGLLVRVTLGMSLATLGLFGVVATALYLMILWRYRELLQLPVLRRTMRRQRPRTESMPEEEATPLAGT